LIFLNTCLQLPLPLLAARFVDSVVGARAGGSALYYAIALISVTVIEYGVLLLNQRVNLGLREEVLLDVQARQARHVYRLPISYFQDKQSSYVQSRIMTDGRSVEGFLPQRVLPLILDLVLYVVVLGCIFAIRPAMGGMVLIGTVSFGSVFYLTSHKVRLLRTNLQETTSRSSAIVADGFAGIRTVKMYLCEDLFSSKVYGQLSRLRDAQFRASMTEVTYTGAATFVSALTGASVITYGAYAILHNRMTVGQLFGVIMFLGLLYRPITTFVAEYLLVQQAAAGTQRIYQLLSLPTETDIRARRLREHGRGCERSGGSSLSFEGVSFGYSKDRPVLADIDLHIQPGECFALVGKSGAGKTTLINLILGLYEGYQGNILLNGAEIGRTPLPKLRRRIGVVDQTAYLFTGTILDNIRIADPDASLDQVVAAARSAFAHDFVCRLADGYNTQIGERGIGLSAGQCQRIALARLFLKNPGIVILDEAISSVDSESEGIIHAALSSLIKGRTSIIVAHRLSSLMLASRVAVLQAGRIVEEGTHNELMVRGPAYRRLFQEQFAPLLAPSSEATCPAAVAV
jgi:ABC-type bacteriocin/lantibiotic exporter with double-glycine peptidase domain